VLLSGKPGSTSKGLVVADTTPLNYLILIDAINVLPRLFHRVCVPEEVAEEMSRPRTPEPVRTWIASSSTWFEIRPAGSIVGDLPKAFGSLYAGERAALILALNL